MVRRSRVGLCLHGLLPRGRRRGRATGDRERDTAGTGRHLRWRLMAHSMVNHSVTSCLMNPTSMFLYMNIVLNLSFLGS